MQHSWMIRFSNKKNLFVFFFIFFQFIEKNTFVENQKFNVFFFIKLNRFFSIQKFYNNFIKKHFNLFLTRKPFLSQATEDVRTDLLQKNIKNRNFFFNASEVTSVRHDIFTNTSKKFYYKLLDFFFLNSFLPYSSFFQRTGFFNLFFFKSSGGSSYIINLNKVLARWVDFFNLISNIYLINLSPLVYSSPFFKTETLALNWNISTWDIKSWKLTYPHFIFKTNYFSYKTSFFYSKLKETGFDLFLVTDCIYHYKNLYFFKKNYYYTIGLISLNVNPWIVAYPVLASTNSFLNQIFFLQSLVYSQKKIFFLQFIFFKKLWDRTTFFRFSNLN